MSERGSRFQSSVVTFGAVGRALVTVVVLAVPIGFVLLGGIFGAVGAVTWCVGVLPRALRDTWRRAALPSTDLTEARDGSLREQRDALRPRGEHPGFSDEAEPPTRW